VGGTPVRVLGRNLDEGTVYVDGSAVPTEECTGENRGEIALCFISPPRVLGRGTDPVALVTVRTPNGKASDVEGFRYRETQAPRIDELRPNSGPDVGGTEVRVEGRNLDQGTVFVDGKAVPTEECRGGGRQGAVTLCFTTPPWSILAPDLVAQVTVRTPNDKTSNAEAFTYQETPAPRIGRLGPSSGPDVGGTEVRVLGRNLDEGTVYFDGTPVPTDECRGEQRGEIALCFTTPPRVVGQGAMAQVTVRTPNGKASNAEPFRYR
jgi:hypothetical protein